MSAPKELLHLSRPEVQNFLDSFDTVFIDLDGVVWYGYHPIEKVPETIRWFTENGKKVMFVTNNSTLDLSTVCSQFLKIGLTVSEEDIVNPAVVIAWYLKKINVQGEVFVIGTSTFIKYLSKEGIQICKPCPDTIPESIPVVVDLIRKKPPIKAVIVDVDVNCNWIKLALASEYLKDKDVCFITGSTDMTLILASDITLLGQGPLINLLSQTSKRQPTKCDKPSYMLKDYIFDKFNVKMPKRCLFVGDSLCHDMEFGAWCGFQKLFVGSGIDKLESVGKDSAVIPDYYLPTLGHIINLIVMDDEKNQSN